MERVGGEGGRVERGTGEYVRSLSPKITKLPNLNSLDSPSLRSSLIQYLSSMEACSMST